MPNRLEPINLIDFTGGLNLRRNQFQLAANESPEMTNITIDPLGGIYTRRGWERWSDDIVESESAWDPRRALLVQLSSGSDIIYIAANNTIFEAGGDGVFTDLELTAEANPHMADFAVFGDDTYFALGHNNQMARRHETDPPELLSFVPAFNDDYLNPIHDHAPACEVCEAHAGYLFVANTEESGVQYPNRVRWSHPTSPDDWAENDFIDILTGGNKITGLVSYEDHLLIFKPDSIWALYGYDLDSWQLVQKSTTIGAHSPQGITRSETACFFYSASDRGGIYAYGGERPMEISEQLRHALGQLITHDIVWVGWIGRKLWVTVPWTYDGPTLDESTAFVFDPTVGERGAWTYFTSMTSSLGPIVAGSNVDTQIRPMGVLRNPEVPCVVRLDSREEAADDIVWEFSVLGFSDPGGDDGYIVTDAGGPTAPEIIMGGAPGVEPFFTSYRTPWVTADWPTRKKSFRRPDFICRITGVDHQLNVRSYRDYEEVNVRRMHTIVVPSGGPPPTSGDPGQIAAVWGHFRWNDGTTWNQEGIPPELATSPKNGASIRRGSSFGLCRSLQLRVSGATSGARWGIDAIILKAVMRRFR
jgi:hypothetical protein